MHSKLLRRWLNVCTSLISADAMSLVIIFSVFVVLVITEMHCSFFTNAHVVIIVFEWVRSFFCFFNFRVRIDLVDENTNEPVRFVSPTYFFSVFSSVTRSASAFSSWSSWTRRRLSNARRWRTGTRWCRNRCVLPSLPALPDAIASFPPPPPASVPSRPSRVVATIDFLIYRLIFSLRYLFNIELR